MDTKVKIGTLKEAADRVVDAWERAERGEHVESTSTISFPDFETFLKVLTPGRFTMLKHLRQHPERSIKALAEALQRDYRHVHGDVKALEDAGLVERAEGTVRATADKVLVEV